MVIFISYLFLINCHHNILEVHLSYCQWVKHYVLVHIYEDLLKKNPQKFKVKYSLKYTKAYYIFSVAEDVMFCMQNIFA